MWFGIILFGMANGFLLLPVILSFVGTIQTVADHTKADHGGKVTSIQDENILNVSE